MIQGVLLKQNGRPLPYTEIELVPVDVDHIINDSRLIGVSGSTGRFTFSNVPWGRYTLSINFDDIPTELSPYDTFFYPTAFDRGDAEILDIKKDTSIKNMVFRLPPALVKRDVVGTVLSDDGTPVKDAMICFTDLLASHEKNCGATRSDASGRFHVVGFENRRYQLGALVFDRNPTPTDRRPQLVAAGESKPFLLGALAGTFDIRVHRAKTVIMELSDKYLA